MGEWLHGPGAIMPSEVADMKLVLVVEHRRPFSPRSYLITKGRVNSTACRVLASPIAGLVKSLVSHLMSESYLQVKNQG